MRNRTVSLFAIAVALLSATMPLFAHHGTSVFDTSKALTMKGRVSEWDWSNPHCLLQFDVKSEGGEVVHWIGETQNPANMVFVGWGKGSFKPGDEVTVTLMPAKNGRPFGRIKQVVLPDGKTLDANDGSLTPKDSAASPSGSKSGNYIKKWK